MQNQFKLLIQARKTFNLFLKTMTIDELNYIPPHFRNNIIWNIGHCIITQDTLCYKLSNLPSTLDAQLVANYKKGSLGDRHVSQEEINTLKGLLRLSTDKLIEDYTQGVFKEYTPYETSYGATLDSIDMAITFNNVHEAIHMGYIMAMIRSQKSVD